MKRAVSISLGSSKRDKEENITLLQAHGLKMHNTSTPRYEGRSFGTNMMKAALTAYAGQGRQLTDEELNCLIDEPGLKPNVINL